MILLLPSRHAFVFARLEAGQTIFLTVFCFFPRVEEKILGKMFVHDFENGSDLRTNAIIILASVAQPLKKNCETPNKNLSTLIFNRFLFFRHDEERGRSCHFPDSKSPQFCLLRKIVKIGKCKILWKS